MPSVSDLRKAAKANTLSRAADAQRDPAETAVTTYSSPGPAEGPSSTAPLTDVAPNPFNTRRITSTSKEVIKIKNSISAIGQLAPCAVVTRDAFLRIFPEYQTDPKLALKIAEAPYIQVVGGQRWVALHLLADREMKIDVQDNLAKSRAIFLKATMEENIARRNYDPIEEAQAIVQYIEELGQKQLAARELHRTAGWVSQRLVLLELEPEIQEALRGDEALRSDEDDDDLPAFPVSRAREMGGWARALQLAELEQWRASKRPAPPVEEPAEKPDAKPKVPVQRVSRRRAALLKLGNTADEIAQSLKEEMDPDDRRALGRLLLEDDEEN